MEALTTAFFIAALALFGKIFFDLWNRHQERLSIAGALAGEIGAYISFFKSGGAADGYRKLATIPPDVRRRILAAFPPVPSGHPVFDKVAGRLGLLSASQARKVSVFYNVVTGTRLLITNLFSPAFLAADDEVQKSILEQIARLTDQHLPSSEMLVTELESASQERLLAPMWEIASNLRRRFLAPKG
jgi:hypothetical protein